MDIHEDHLKKFFEPGKSIRPSEHFTNRSLSTILAASRETPSVLERIRREFIGNLTSGFAIGLAAIFIFIAFSGTTSWERLIPGNAERAGAELLSEAASLNFDIQLGEAAYFITQSPDEVAVVLESLHDAHADRARIDALLEEALF